jgi:hypothetical protein
MEHKKSRLGLLPFDRCPADNEWISEKLAYLDENDRRAVCKAYSKAYREAVENEPLERKQINQGRFNANTRLRVFIEKRLKSLAVFNKA